MDRGWYLRFGFMMLVTVLAVLVLWPSVSHWVPAPSWVTSTFKSRIAPGLDIKGGLRLMYEVDVDRAIEDRRNRAAEDLLERMGRALGIIGEDGVPSAEKLAEVRRKVTVERVGERRIKLTFKSAGDSSKLTPEIVETFADLREISRSQTEVVFEMRGDRLEALRADAVAQAVETITNRIDELQVKENSVSARENDVIIEIPGEEKEVFDRIREIISRTARLEFKILADEDETVAGLTDLPEGIERQTEFVSAGEQRPQVQSAYLVARGPDARAKLTAYIAKLAEEGKISEGHELLIGELDEEDGARNTGAGTARRPGGWRTYFVTSRADVTGEHISDAFIANDPQDNKPFVSLQFDGEGAEKFERVTGQNVKRRMAIVLDDRVASAPVIQTKIGGGRCQITLGTNRDYNAVLNEARDLVVVLKAGALPAPIVPSNEQLIGASLGEDSVAKGQIGALVGIVLVLLFMMIYYEVAGVVADIAVVLNVLFLMALLAAIEATMTLPGIAGIALTVGMSVDANVLVNERIREEIKLGKSPRAAVDQGFSRAFWTIFDGHVTTFIAGVVLFQYGSGPIKGFAVTLMLGIAASLFTGTFCSRVVMDWIVRGLRVQRLRVG